MEDMQRVLDGLEEITGYSCEQMSLFDNDVFIRGIAQDALELLKEQNPVKPIQFEKKSRITRDKYECGACGSSEVFKEWEYCPWCGKPIDWSKDGEQE